MNMTHLGKFLNRLKHSVSGSAVVEMGLYMPIAIVLFAGMLDFSLAVSQKLRAQQAVARTLEMTSNVGFTGLGLAMMRQEAAVAANVSETSVTAEIWLECDGVKQTNLYGTCTTSDGLARYASISIEDEYQLTLYDKVLKSANQSNLIGFSVQGSLRIQ